MILGILGFGPIGIIAAVGGGISLLSAGFTVWSYYDTKDSMEARDKKNANLQAKNDRRSKAMAFKEFNKSLGMYNRGTLAAKLDLIQKERENKQADTERYGRPIRADRNVS